jgi:heptosyltransferase II
MRILFVKLGAIGDIIQSAVALTEYRSRFPEAQVDWITGTGMDALVRGCGVADRVIAVDEAAMVFGPLSTRVRRLAQSMWAVSKQCAPRYDSVLTAYLDQRSKALTRLIRCNTRRCLSDVSYPGGRPGWLLPRSRVHEYWRLLTGQDSQSIDIAAATTTLGLRLRQHAVSEPAVINGSGYVVVAAGGAKNTQRDDALRRWPLGHYQLLVQHLVRQGQRVVLVGAPSDQWVSEAIHGEGVENLIGKTSLMQLLNVIENSSAVVANDSGLFHMATLTTAGLVGLFGPTPANAVAPLGRARTRILSADNRVSCSPCYDGRNYAACTRNLCLESIPVSAVAEALAAVS